MMKLPSGMRTIAKGSAANTGVADTRKRRRRRRTNSKYPARAISQARLVIGVEALVLRIGGPSRLPRCRSRPKHPPKKSRYACQGDEVGGKHARNHLLSSVRPLSPSPGDTSTLASSGFEVWSVPHWPSIKSTLPLARVPTRTRTILNRKQRKPQMNQCRSGEANYYPRDAVDRSATEDERFTLSAYLALRVGAPDR